MPIEKYHYQTVAALEQRIGTVDQLLNEGYQNITASKKMVYETEVREVTQVLYIEGITSAGKTTLLEEMARTMPEATYIPEFYRKEDPPKQYRNLNPQVSIAQKLRAEFWFYSQYLQKNREIRQSSGKVIVDRGLLGLFCYSNLLDGQQEVSSRIMLQAMQQDWMPGVYIFLTARPEIIKQRLLTRQDTARITQQDWNNGVGEFIEILHDSVEDVAQKAGAILVDTSDETPQEVFSEVKNRYNQFYAN